MICAPVSLSAQITIGSGAEPSEWSLLYLDASEQRKALHNARLTYNERNTLVPPVPYEGFRREPERGLMIFNIDNNCLEYWNGERWVSLCVSDRVCPPTGVMVGEMCWARANLSTPGVFATTPAETGLFQWNRNTAWPITGTVTNWDSTADDSNTWVNDPCPQGWRIPTASEWSALIALETPVLLVDYAIRFGGTEGILLPIVPNRIENGGLAGALGTGITTVYWSSTPSGTQAAALMIQLNMTGCIINNINNSMWLFQRPRTNAFAIRCIFPLD